MRIEEEIRRCKSIEEIIEIITNDLFEVKINLENHSTLKREVNLNNPIRKTFCSIYKKIKARNSREVGGKPYSELDTDDINSIAFMYFIQILKLTYEDKIKLNGIELDDNLSQLDRLKECFNDKNISKYMSIIYNRCINKDFDENVLNNTYNQFTVVNRSGGKVEYKNIDTNLSFDKELETDEDGNSMSVEEMLYVTSETFRELFDENINYNSTNVISILLNNTQILTRKQKEFLSHMANLIELNIHNIWASDNIYSADSKRQYKNYIISSFYKNIEEGRINGLGIKRIKNKKYIIQINNNYQLDSFLNKLKSINNPNERIKFLNSKISKDNKLAEQIVELMLDKGIYEYYMQMVNNDMSTYKFNLVYLNTLLKEGE